MATARLVVLSDLHVGSIYGLWPEGFRTAGGGAYALNPGQAYLWKCWTWTLDKLRELRPTAVILNGDILDGRQQAQRATEAVTVSMTDQQEAAISLLSPLREIAPTLFGVQGSEYHDQTAGEACEAVYKALGCATYDGPGVGFYGKETLDLKVGHTIINVSHGISVSGGLYRATAPDREGVWSALAGKEGRTPAAHVVVRSHAHHWVYVQHPTKHILITPCWQLQTRYMRRLSAYRMLPDIGFVTIEIDTEVKPSYAEDPVRISRTLFGLPERRPAALKL